MDSTGTAFNGTFTMMFANGTVFGYLGEAIDASRGPTAIIIDQRINVIGGTGAFLWYNGLITASGTIDATSTTPALFSGTGTLNTTPEPASFLLAAPALAGLWLMRRKRAA